MRVEQQLGPQQISVNGVPGSSHFARVLVAADYRMKRISMELEPSPVPGLTSFLQMARGGGGAQNTLPRWWLAPDYGPLVRDADGLAWELPDGSVKAMAENDFVDASGAKRATGKTDVVSQRWADMMTSKYEELSRAEPVFAELRNCMDLAVAAALIVTQKLPERAGADLSMLLNSDGYEPANLPVPKQVASKAALVHKSRAWVIMCGGVQINPWEIVARSEQKPALAELRGKTALADGSAWWAN